ncbi:hypothetical protein VTP01DRAFT_3769 [Rhizomucor pusillus]|uniref:uncharacterized protein n=1 Tax=Rhizomucor pusillus TaxID=4840 RepID=UPI003743D124
MHLVGPDAETTAPKIVGVRARVYGTVTTSGEPFRDQAMLRFVLVWKSGLIKEDTGFPNDHISLVSFAHPVKALLSLRLAVCIHSLAPGFFQCQVAPHPHEVMKMLFETQVSQTSEAAAPSVV